ncbi:hypothetical protein [Okeania sp. SIO1I7]|uniref:hypothetical protein n=1 Tax=Okeania sp. SIO1I7 TaxID=2607772 RepID=UPI0013F7F096|nr:hypothetical protein [Okeania sp. SIO1I7]NET29704.1 hypothetical protein [Okeania sp. SIO1I7]
METLLLSYEEVGKIAEQLYQNSIRAAVEIPENIGKMVIIDIETGDYSVNKNGLEAANYLYEKNPLARLFGIRIGYKVAVSFSGSMERVI